MAISAISSEEAAARTHRYYASTAITAYGFMATWAVRIVRRESMEDGRSGVIAAGHSLKRGSLMTRRERLPDAVRPIAGPHLQNSIAYTRGADPRCAEHSARIIIITQHRIAEIRAAHEPVVSFRESIAAARAAAQQGDWDRVAALVDRMSPTSRRQRIEVGFLTARAALHVGLPERALLIMEDMADLLSDDELAWVLTLRGSALAALGRDEEGTALLQQVAESATGPQRAEAVYQLAKAHARAGRLNSAEAILAPLVDAGQAGASEVIVVQALELYGRIEVERRRPPVAARHFLDALEVLGRFSKPYTTLRAALVHDLAIIAVDTLDLRLFARVRREWGAITWPVGLANTYAAVLRLSIAGELLAGNEPTAWAMALEALRTAPAGSRYVAALLDMALVCSAGGERFAHDQFVLTAADVARHVDWDGSDRRALLDVIQQITQLDAPTIDELLALYDTLPPCKHVEDNGQVAELLARAVFLGVRGQQPAQIAALRTAVTRARDAGSYYGEAAALFALLEADPDSDLLRRADELTQLVPLSWLRRRYDVVAEHIRGFVRLSAAERRVVQAICEGRSTAEIARAFGRSKNTIRNQTRRIFEVMNVHTRSALVAKFAMIDRMQQVKR